MLTNEDFLLFQQATQGAKKLKQDSYFPPKLKSVKPKIKISQAERRDLLFYFSDEYEPLLNQEGEVAKYLRLGEDSYLLKQLRRGDFQPQLFLDLHGLTRKQAKLELVSLLQACEKEKIHCVSIMTGFGTYTLKQQIPRWLVQYPKIRAFHQAPQKWGGRAAILILVDVVNA